MNGTALRRFMMPTVHRIMALVTRGIGRRIDDGHKLQEMQVETSRGHLTEGAEVFGRYGFTSYCHPNPEVIMLAVGGNRDHPLVIAAENRQHRPQGGAEGEVLLYDDQGQTITLKRGNVIEVATTGTVELTAGATSITVDASGGVTVTSAGGITLDCPGQPFVVNAASVDFNTA